MAFNMALKQPLIVQCNFFEKLTINKLEEYKSDKEGLYNLIDKYYDINKSEYDSYNFEQIIASYGLMIQSSIEKEYGILPYCYYEYDVKNSNIVATATSDTYENIYK